MLNYESTKEIQGDFWVDNTNNWTVKHDSIHFIPTAGPPVTAEARQLYQVQLIIAKEVFDYMVDKNIVVDPLTIFVPVDWIWYLRVRQIGDPQDIKSAKSNNCGRQVSHSWH